LRWLQIELRLSGELAEPVAEVLGRHAHGGAVVSGTDLEDPAHAVVVSAYLEANPELEVRRSDIATALWHLGQIQPLPDPTFRWIEDEDWSETWRRHYQPLPVGQGLLVQPAWLALEDSDRLPVLIDPGMAFGTGTHPSTTLALELIERWIQPGWHVADVGCGSGILAIAALLLGAARATAVDIEPAAIAATRKNALANQVGDRIHVMLGSLPDLLAVMDPVLRFDLVAANMLAPVLEDLLGNGLGHTLAEGSCLVLSGILEEQLADVQAASARAGLAVVEERADQDWRALLMKKAAR
jgi:ribosomal protein L11 methyltransferase